MPKSWIIEGRAERGGEPEEYFIKYFCAYSFLGICLSSSSLCLVLSPLPRSFWNDAHLFPLSHLCHISLIYSLCCLSLPQPTYPTLPPSLPPPPPPSSSHSLDDFKWPQGKLFGVQVEFRRRPGSLSLLSLSKPTRESLPWLPLDMGSTSELKAPQNGNRNSVPWASGFVFDQMSCCLSVWHWARLCLMAFSFAF